MKKLAFLFAGIGTQWQGMAATLRKEDSSFTQSIKNFDDCFYPLSGFRVEDSLKDSEIYKSHIGHPCITAVAIAIAHHLKKQGITPDLLIGHSSGEIVAAYISGILTMEDTAKIVWWHCQILEAAAGKGGMIHFPVGLEKAQHIIDSNDAHLEVAALNGSNATVIGGTTRAILRLFDQYSPVSDVKKLSLDIPFHTSELKQYLDLFPFPGITTARGTIPVISTLTGKILDGIGMDSSHWIAHITQPVQFYPAIKKSLATGHGQFVEISPHPVLSSLVSTIGGTDALLVSETLVRDGNCQLKLSTTEKKVKAWQEESRYDLPGHLTPKLFLGLSPVNAKKLLQEKIHQGLSLVLPGVEIHNGQPFQLHGLKSYMAVNFALHLSDTLGYPVPVTDIFNAPSVNELIEFLYSKLNNITLDGAEQSVENQYQSSKQSGNSDSDPIAIVGIGCRFPGGAVDPDSYWQLISEGKDAVATVPTTRWSSSDFYDEDKTLPGKTYTKEGGFLTGDLSLFDAPFFNISSREAEQLDPQQRLLLEVSWEAFEEGNISPSRLTKENVGVFLGLTGSDYTHAHRDSYLRERINAYSLTGTTESAAAGRLSYFYGFEGPCFSVDTACSSSLVALHQACKSIQSDESSFALVGSATLMLIPDLHICFSKLGAISPDGRSKSFDDSANGYGRGEGCGVVLLQKLSHAMRDKNQIHGIIKGTAINQDGKSNGFTAPNGLAQEKVIKKALDAANISHLEVDYVEAHGTGTELGDAIELNSLASAYCTGRPLGSPLKIGSVKANIGHLEPVAGIASLIKAVLCIKHQTIPANIHVKTPNTKFDWPNNSIEAPTQSSQWTSEDKTKRAGLSSFGFSGINAHAIVEEYSGDAFGLKDDCPAQLILLLSAKTASALKKLAKAHCSALAEVSLDTARAWCKKTALGREHFAYRLAVTADSVEALVEKLSAKIAKIDQEKMRVPSSSPIIGLFTGQGSQYPDMGKELYATFPVFRDAINHCHHILNKDGIDLKHLLYGGVTREHLAQTINAQPTIASISYALCRLWQSWGIDFTAVAGHSIGEYPAAVIAGAMELEEMLSLAAYRGKIMETAATGTMVAVFMETEALERLVLDFNALKDNDQVCIGAYNTPHSATVAGSHQAIDNFIKLAEEKNIATKKIHVAKPFHSPAMQPSATKLFEKSQTINFRQPTISFISTVTGKEETSLNATYWSKQVREPVRFLQSIEQMDNYGQIAIEVGPSASLSGFIHQSNDNITPIATLSPKISALKSIFEALVRLYESGIDLTWDNVFELFPDMDISLPKYPFEYESYWLPVQVESPNKDDIPQCAAGTQIHSPGLGDTIVFESVFSDEGPAFLHEHIILGNALSPAAGHLSMIFAAVNEVWGSPRCQLRNVAFSAPLAVLPKERRTVQIIISAESEDKRSFELVSCSDDSGKGKWVTHCNGDLFLQVTPQPSVNKAVTTGTIQEDYPTQKEAQAFYKKFISSGYNLAESFQRVSNIYLGAKGSLCHVKTKQDNNSERGHVIYPGSMDSILQTSLPLFIWSEDSNTLEDSNLLIPMHIDRVDLWEDIPDSVVCLSEARVGENSTIMESQTIALANDGTPVMQLYNATFRATAYSTLYRQLVNDPRSMVYAQEWLKLPEMTTDHSNSDAFFIISTSEDKSSFGTQLSDWVEQPLYSLNNTNQDDIHDAIEQTSKSHYGKPLKIVFEASNTLQTKEIWDVFPSPSHIFNNEVMLCSQLSSICSEVIARDINARIYLVTTNCMTPSNSCFPAGASAWGLMSTLGAEQPDLCGGVIDIPEIISPKESKNIIEILIGERTDFAIGLKNGELYERQLLKSAQDKGETTTENNFSTNGTYLITGGTGALGLESAQWLASKNVEHIVLLSRSGIQSPQSAKIIDEIKAKGVGITLIKGDTTKEDDVYSTIATIRRECPPLTGIFHTAGILEDGIISTLSFESYQRVMAPKLGGALYLHLATLEENLSCFVLFSSLGTLLGSQGQANYNCANHGLNSFAQWRRSNGLPALSVCWGPWLNGGMAEQDRAQGHLSKQGIMGMKPEQALDAFTTAQEQDSSVAGVALMNWELFASARDLQNSFYFSALVQKEWYQNQETNNRTQYFDGLSATLEGQGDKEKYAEVVKNGLTAICCSLLGFNSSRTIASNVALMEQGFDSLMAVEFRTIINKELKVKMPVSLVFEYPTIDHIVQWFITTTFTEPQESCEKAEIAVAVNKNGMTDMMNETEDLLSDIDQLLEGSHG